MFVYFRHPYTGDARIARLVVDSEQRYRERLAAMDLARDYIDLLVFANRLSSLKDPNDPQAGLIVVDQMVPSKEPERFTHLVAYAQYAVEVKGFQSRSVRDWINDHLPVELREVLAFPIRALPPIGGPRFGLEPSRL